MSLQVIFMPSKKLWRIMEFPLPTETIRNDIDVNEHDRLLNFTPRHKLK